MSSMFSGPPKAPKAPDAQQPVNTQLDAEAAANAQKRGAAASVLTTQAQQKAGSIFGD